MGEGEVADFDRTLLAAGRWYLRFFVLTEPRLMRKRSVVGHLQTFKLHPSPNPVCL